jgi:hypothetical protein
MLLGRVPTILVLLVGIILSFVFWSRKPRQSVWVMLASVIALANIVSYDVVWAILWSRGAAASHRDLMTAMGWSYQIVAVASYGCFFVAAWSGRAHERAFPAETPPPLANRA